MRRSYAMRRPAICSTATARLGVGADDSSAFLRASRRSLAHARSSGSNVDRHVERQVAVQQWRGTIRDDRRRQLSQVERTHELAVDCQTVAGADVDDGRGLNWLGRGVRNAPRTPRSSSATLDSLQWQPDSPHGGLERRTAVAGRHDQVALTLDELRTDQVRAEPGRQVLGLRAAVRLDTLDNGQCCGRLSRITLNRVGEGVGAHCPTAGVRPDA